MELPAQKTICKAPAGMSSIGPDPVMLCSHQLQHPHAHPAVYHSPPAGAARLPLRQPACMQHTHQPASTAFAVQLAGRSLPLQNALLARLVCHHASLHVMCVCDCLGDCLFHSCLDGICHAPCKDVSATCLPRRGVALMPADRRMGCPTDASVAEPSNCPRLDVMPWSRLPLAPARLWSTWPPLCTHCRWAKAARFAQTDETPGHLCIRNQCIVPALHAREDVVARQHSWPALICQSPRIVA